MLRRSREGKTEGLLYFENQERNVESVKVAKDERFRETRNAMHVMQAKLEEQLKVKLDALNGTCARLTTVPR